MEMCQVLEELSCKTQAITVLHCSNNYGDSAAFAVVCILSTCWGQQGNPVLISRLEVL